MHPDVVAGDVRLGVGARLGHRLQRGSARAHRETPGEARLGPLPARPARRLRDHFLKVGLREVEQGDEGELRGEQILRQMRRHVEGREALVDIHLRAELQLVPAPQRPADLQHVAVDLLERRREAAKDRLQLLAIGDEGVFDEGAQGGRVSVAGAPVGRHLPDAALGPDAGRLTMFLHQRGDETGLVHFDPGTRRSGESRLGLARSRRLFATGGPAAGRESERCGESGGHTSSGEGSHGAALLERLSSPVQRTHS